MDIIDAKGKTVHYSDSWAPVTFTDGRYKPKKSFRIYVEVSLTLTLKGVNMKRSEAFPITLTEGYHNFVCDEVLEAGSDPPTGALALF